MKDESRRTDAAGSSCCRPSGGIKPAGSFSRADKNVYPTKALDAEKRHTPA